MRTLIFTAAALLMAPMLHAQQAETKETPTQAAPAASTSNSNEQPGLSNAIKPGHPLDPADVDILTGKKDREIEISRRGLPLAVNGYGAYAGLHGLNGRRDEMLDVSLLPLTRINNPYLFYRMQPRSFGRGSGRSRLR